ncbi:MAG: patatin-like phospholipase family protein [Patescibacteria group bacterium]|jgi:NTE family protein
MNKRKKVGLALGSGGARGLAHIGVLKALLKNEIPIDFFSGSSIGSFVSAHFSLHQDIDKLEQDTLYYKKDKILTFFEPSLHGGLVKGGKVEKYLRSIFAHTKIQDLSIPCGIVATDLISGEQEAFLKGDVVTALRASMAVPGLFKPVEWHGKILVDGGVSNPIPDDILRKMGAEVIISVNLDDCKAHSTFNKSRLTYFNTTLRSFQILRHHLAQYCMKDSDFILNLPIPYTAYEGAKKYFTAAIENQLIEIGEKETEKIIHALKKLIY